MLGKDLRRKNIFLTGSIGAGKSTAISRVLLDLQLNICGFKTKREVEGDSVKGYYIIDIVDSSFSSIAYLDENRIIHPVIEGFETIGVRALRRASDEQYKAVIMDELGFLEEEALSFQEEVFKVLKSDKLVLGAIKKKETSFLDKVKELSFVIEVNLENRDSIHEEIRRLIWDSMRT